MKQVSRRYFLEQLGAVAATVLLARIQSSAQPFAGDGPFEMLVVGDSHMSGQGLREENKFYFLIKEWLRTNAFGSEREVRLKVKAHSGARIELHADELSKMQAAGDDIFKAHHQEANLSQPSIRSQIDAARREYSDTSAVDLVMLSGGITDVLVANTINPFFPAEKLRLLIRQYCNDGMHSLLKHAAAIFPNAKIVVVGYFPIVSTGSDVNKVSRYLLKAVKFPHPLHVAITNGASKQFMKVLRKKMAERSRLWVTESNRAYTDAVARVNADMEESRVIFVESPISEARCFGTERPMLWDTDKDNLPADERYIERKKMCSEVFSELKHHHYGKMSVRMCELAAIGHPNVEGARATAEAIKEKLRSTFAQTARPSLIPTADGS
jgi:hypothetical protein